MKPLLTEIWINKKNTGVISAKKKTLALFNIWKHLKFVKMLKAFWQMNL